MKQRELMLMREIEKQRKITDNCISKFKLVKKYLPSTHPYRENANLKNEISLLKAQIPPSNPLKQSLAPSDEENIPPNLTSHTSKAQNLPASKSNIPSTALKSPEASSSNSPPSPHLDSPSAQFLSLKVEAPKPQLDSVRQKLALANKTQQVNGKLNIHFTLVYTNFSPTKVKI